MAGDTSAMENMDVFTESCRAQVRQNVRLLDQVEQWKIDHDDAMKSYDVEFALAHTMAMADCIALLWKKLFQFGELQGFSTFHDAVQSMHELLRCGLDQANRIREQASSLVEKEYVISGFEDLHERIEALEHGLDQAARFPKLTETRIDAARKEFEAGNCRTAKEIADEIRRQSSHACEAGSS